MMVCLFRDHEVFQFEDERWGSIVAAAINQGWNPARSVPGPDRLATVEAWVNVANRRVDSATALGLAAGYRAFLNLTSPAVVTASIASRNAGHDDATHDRMKDPIVNQILRFLGGGAFAISRQVSLASGGKEVFRIDTRGWGLLQSLAFQKTGWLPTGPLCPNWLASELRGAWTSRYPGGERSVATESGSLFEKFTRGYLKRMDAQTWALSLMLALEDCSATDQLPMDNAIGFHGKLPSDDVHATPREWFSGGRRERADAFVQVLRTHPRLKVC